MKLALKNNPFSCTNCSKEVKVVVGSEDTLPAAHFIGRLKEFYTNQERALRRDVVCEVCTKNKSPGRSILQASSVRDVSNLTQ